MRTINVGPLLEDCQDLGDLVGEQSVHRRTTRCPVDQVAAGAAGQPPVRTPGRQLEDTAGAAQAPTGLHGFVEKLQEYGFGGRIDTAWDLSLIHISEPTRPY